jgi:hypothetical protein
MEIREAVDMLRQYNKCRRWYDGTYKTPTRNELGTAIDAVCDYIERGEDDGK